VLCSSGRGKLHKVAGNSGSIVASNVALIEIIPKNRNHAESFDCVEIGNDLARALERVLSFESVGNRSAIDQRVVEDLLSGVAVESTDVIGGRQAKTLVGLRHQIADVNLGGR